MTPYNNSIDNSESSDRSDRIGISDISESSKISDNNDDFFKKQKHQKIQKKISKNKISDDQKSLTAKILKANNITFLNNTFIKKKLN